ncbi:hypothetical protein Tco_0832898 [Tanacetum coccineum]
MQLVGMRKWRTHFPWHVTLTWKVIPSYGQGKSDDEESNHEDASDTGAAPKHTRMMPQSTAISNIKSPNFLKKGEKSEGNSKKRISTEGWYCSNTFTRHIKISIHGMDDAKEIWEAIRTRKSKVPSKNLFKCSKSSFVQQSKSSTNKVKSGFTGAYSTCTPSTSSTNIPEKEVLAGFPDESLSIPIFAKQS